MALAAGNAFVPPGPRRAATAFPISFLAPPTAAALLLSLSSSWQPASGAAMEDGAVYNETTEPQAKPPRRPFGCTLRHLWGWRLPTKALQAVSPLPSSPLLSPAGSGGRGRRRAKWESGARAAVAARRRAVADWLTDLPRASTGSGRVPPSQPRGRGRAGPCAGRAPPGRMAAWRRGERPKVPPRWPCAGLRPAGRRRGGGEQRVPRRRLGPLPLRRRLSPACFTGVAACQKCSFGIETSVLWWPPALGQSPAA